MMSARATQELQRLPLQRNRDCRRKHVLYANSSVASYWEQINGVIPIRPIYTETTETTCTSQCQKIKIVFLSILPKACRWLRDDDAHYLA